MNAESKTDFARRLILNSRLLNMAELERNLDIPRGTLEQFRSGRRGLPKKYADKIADMIDALSEEEMLFLRFR